MAYALLLLFECMITLEMFLFLSFSSFRIAHSKKIHIPGNPKSDYFMADKKLAPETD
jgi:hypothetical protein